MASKKATVCSAKATRTPVVVCTDKRGVVFGYTADVSARPIVLSDARMCLEWDKIVGGVFGLTDVGPIGSSRVSATAPYVTLEGVTAVLTVAPNAERAWAGAKVQGR